MTNLMVMLLQLVSKGGGKTSSSTRVFLSDVFILIIFVSNIYRF